MKKIFLVVGLLLASAARAQDLPGNILAGGVRGDFSFQPRPKVTASFLQASKLAGDNFYSFNTVDAAPQLVKSGGKTVLTLQTTTQAGVAPIVARYKGAAFFLIGQAGFAFRPSYAGGLPGVASGIATAVAASTGAGVGFPLPGVFAKKHKLVSITAVRYTFSGGIGLDGNQVVTFIGKGL